MMTTLVKLYQMIVIGYVLIGKLLTGPKAAYADVCEFCEDDTEGE